MIHLTQSLTQFLFTYHRGILAQISFGHIELYTKKIEKEYIEWCKTEEGKKYLRGGEHFKEDHFTAQFDGGVAN